METSRILALAASVLALACPAGAPAQQAGLIVVPHGGGRAGPVALPGAAGRGGSASFATGVGRSLGHGGWRGRQQQARHGRWPGYGYVLYGGYGGLVEDPESLRDQGYFAGPAVSAVAGGRAAYDYDRAYPYDWYRDPPARTALVRAEAPPPRAPEYRCSVEQAGVRVCRGR